jgi:hypothetical protein
MNILKFHQRNQENGMDSSNRTAGTWHYICGRNRRQICSWLHLCQVFEYLSNILNVYALHAPFKFCIILLVDR